MRDDGRSESLDGLRGIAVILTFCVHFFGTAIFLKYRASPDLLSIGQMKNAGDSLSFALFRSHYGVYLFFIISGFLIGRIVIADTPPFYRHFLWRRIQRIYPPFLLSFALAVIARVTYGGGYDPVSMPTLSGVIANLLFLNGLSALNVQVLIPNNVTWSLFFEMAFYIIAPLSWLVASGRTGLIALSCFGLWLAIILPDQTSAPLFVPLFAGALLACVPARSLRDYMKRIPSVVVVALFILTAAIWSWGNIGRFQYMWLFSGPATLLVASAVYGDGWLSRILAMRPLAWLGRVSYSFYLLHSLVLFGSLGLFRIDLGGMGFIKLCLVWVQIFLITSAVSWLSYLASERFYFRKNAPPLALQAA